MNQAHLTELTLRRLKRINQAIAIIFGCMILSLFV